MAVLPDPIQMDPTSGATGFQPVIDALTAHVALVDAESRIVAVNAAWKAFADRNGASLGGYGVGSSYLELLEGIRCRDEDDEKTMEDACLACQVADGLRKVLAGELSSFQVEYPCHSASERRWFLVTVTPFRGGPLSGAVVAHENVTPLKLAEEDVRKKAGQLARMFGSTVEAIALAIEKRDPYTAGHQREVTILCELLGRRLGLDSERLYGLRLGASIHDIGKIQVPVEILNRPGGLTPTQKALIDSHVEAGYEILQGIDFPWPIAEMVHQHHERLDGSGYPQGLAGDAICLEARILAVADVWEAITSHRPYRPARSREVGIEELEAGRGIRYDPGVVDALLDHLRVALPG